MPILGRGMSEMHITIFQVPCVRCEQVSEWLVSATDLFIKNLCFSNNKYKASLVSEVLITQSFYVHVHLQN